MIDIRRAVIVLLQTLLNQMHRRDNLVNRWIARNILAILIKPFILHPLDKSLGITWKHVE